MLKKLLSIVIVVIMLMSVIAVCPVVSTAESNFKGYTAITNAQQLYDISKDMSGKYYLANDIVFEERNYPYDRWYALGVDTNTAFTGVFDGNGHTISNLKFTYYNTDSSLVGLFGTNKGTIKNLGIINMRLFYTMSIGRQDKELAVGTIATINEGTIENCYVKNNIYSINMTSDDINYDDLYYLNVVFGGITVENKAGIIKNCYNDDCDIKISVKTDSEYVLTSAACSGIALTNSEKGEIINCYNTSSIELFATDVALASGVVCTNESKVTDCCNSGTVTTSVDEKVSFLIDCSAGIVTSNGPDAIVSKCINKGNINGHYYAGGVVGSNSENAKIESSCNTGKVATTCVYETTAGGITAENYGYITDCYNSGNIHSTSAEEDCYAGGLVGFNAYNVTRCYSIGLIYSSPGENQNGYFGLLIAKNELNNGGSVSFCFYEEGKKSSSDTNIGIAIPKDQLSNPSSYRSFDFTNTWLLDKDLSYCYPILRLSCNLGHTFKNVVTPATIDTKGVIEEKCLLCDVVLKSTPIKTIKSIGFENDSKIYNGKAKLPVVDVIIKGGEYLVEDEDFTVTYNSDFKSIGKHTATVTLKGNYSGVHTITYTITPKGAKFSKVTPAKGQIKLKWKKVKDVNGYEIQYSLNKNFKKGNKTVKIKKASKVSNTIKKLKSKKTYYVRIRTYKKVKKATLYSLWSSAKKVKVK